MAVACVSQIRSAGSIRIVEVVHLAVTVHEGSAIRMGRSARAYSLPRVVDTKGGTVRMSRRFRWQSQRAQIRHLAVCVEKGMRIIWIASGGIGPAHYLPRSRCLPACPNPSSGRLYRERHDWN